MAGLSKTFAAVLLILALLTALVGCALPGRPLVDTQWRLVGGTIRAVELATLSITAKFGDGQISGNSGVNRYQGSCTLGPGDAFSVGPLASTRMAGPEPAMRAETAYLMLLGQATSYKRADGKLTLYDKGGNESLIFESTGK